MTSSETPSILKLDLGIPARRYAAQNIKAAPVPVKEDGASAQYCIDLIPAFLRKKSPLPTTPEAIKSKAQWVGIHIGSWITSQFKLRAGIGFFAILVALGSYLLYGQLGQQPSETGNASKVQTVIAGSNQDDKLVSPGMSRPVEQTKDDEIPITDAPKTQLKGQPEPSVAPLKLADIKSTPVNLPVVPKLKAEPIKAEKNDQTAAAKETKPAMILDAEDDPVKAAQFAKAPPKVQAKEGATNAIQVSPKMETKKKTALVAITPDGRFALFTNPETRLPERFAPGEMLRNGDKLIAIDKKSGTVKTSSGEFVLE